MIDPAFAIAALQSFPKTLRAIVREIPAAALDFRPASWEGVPSEMLTMRQQVCHLRDIEADGYRVRFERTVREDSPTLPSIDAYEYARRLKYDEAQVEEALNTFELSRSRNIALLNDLSADQFKRKATFEGYGEVTMSGLAYFLVSHDQQHLAGIHWLLGKHSSAK